MQVNGTPARATFKTTTHHFVCSVYLLAALYGACLQLSPHVFIPTFIAFAYKYEFGRFWKFLKVDRIYFFLLFFAALTHPPRGFMFVWEIVFRGVYECVINPFVFSARIKDRELVYFRFLFFGVKVGSTARGCRRLTLSPFVSVSVTAIVSPWVSERVRLCDKRED